MEHQAIRELTDEELLLVSGGNSITIDTVNIGIGAVHGGHHNVNVGIGQVNIFEEEVA